MNNHTGQFSETGSATSASLLRRLKAREQDAWSRLTRIYGPLIYGWCRRLGLGSADAADVFQEVFSSVFQGIDGFRDDGSFRGWLWTITRNKVRDLHRRRGENELAIGGTDAQRRMREIPDLPEQFDDVTDHRDTNALLHRALEMVRAEFQPQTWQAFWRIAVEGESTADVAADLEISANGARQAKSRVLRRLRLELGGPE